MEKKSILAYIYCGLLTLLVFQGVSGLLLSLNYLPVMEDFQAMKSVQAIGSVVKYGWFFQALHKHGVHLIVIVSLMSMILNIRKEQFTFSSLLKWWSYVFTVLFVLFAVYSGNILVGDGYASQSYQIGGNIVKEIPIFGNVVHFLVFTPNQQELQTFSLVRMYVSHIVFLPILIGLALSLQKPNNIREIIPPSSMLFTILTVIILQILLAFVLPSNPKIVPYSPDWFFLPIHYLQQEVPSIITGLFLGGSLMSLLLLPILFSKKKDSL